MFNAIPVVYGSHYPPLLVHLKRSDGKVFFKTDVFFVANFVKRFFGTPMNIQVQFFKHFVPGNVFIPVDKSFSDMAYFMRHVLKVYAYILFFAE